MMTSSQHLACKRARDASLKTPGRTYVVWSIPLEGSRLGTREYFVEQEGSLQNSSWTPLCKYLDGNKIH